MLMTSRGIRWCALGCAAALLSLAPAAHAAAPEPCDGALLIKDAAGDQVYKVNGNAAPGQAPKPPDNLDVAGLFFRSDEGKTTANVVMTNLTKTVPQGFTAVRYRVYFTVGGKVNYLQALLTSDGVAYSHGVQVVVPAYSFYEKSGDTTGAFHEGKNGVVQIVIPAAVAKAGAKLDAIAASNGVLTAADTPEEGQTAGTYTAVDAAPDASTSTVTTVAPEDCPPPPAPPAPPAAPADDDETPPTTPAPSATDDAPAPAPAMTQASTPLGTLTAPVASGTARLTGPRSPAGPFKVTVTGSQISSVTYYVDGKRVRTVRARRGRTRFSLRIDPRRQSSRVHRVTARVRFSNGSTTTRRIAYRRSTSTPLAPRFTG